MFVTLGPVHNEHLIFDPVGENLHKKCNIWKEC